MQAGEIITHQFGQAYLQDSKDSRVDHSNSEPKNIRNLILELPDVISWVQANEVAIVQHMNQLMHNHTYSKITHIFKLHLSDYTHKTDYKR